jgi:hypothetical protein
VPRSPDRLDRLSLISNVVIAIVTSIGLVSGFFAYLTYKNANAISLSNILETSDNRIYDIALDKDKPYLLRIFYYTPPTNLPPSMQAEKCFNSLFEHDKKLRWKTVPELCRTYMCNVDLLRSDEGKRVMEAILEFEKILGICQTVNGKISRKMLKDTEWPDYVDGYIKDFGENPLFLAAIHIDLVYGYIDKRLSSYLCAKLKDRPVVKIIYPEMSNPDWIKMHGKGDL